MGSTWILHTLLAQKAEAATTIPATQRVHPKKEGGLLHSLMPASERSKVKLWPPSNMAKSQLFQGLGGGLKLLDNQLYWRS